MSENKEFEASDLTDITAEEELDGIRFLLANLHEKEDQLLAAEKKCMLAFTQLSGSKQDEQSGCFMDFLRETERIKRDRSLFATGKRPPKDLWLKMRAAFDADDVETLEEIEKELL